MKRSEVKHKPCSICKALKPIEEFATNGFKSDGVTHKIRSACKVCDKVRVRKYRAGTEFIYLILTCGKCTEESRVRIHKEKQDGTHAFLCVNCTYKMKRSIKKKRSK
jgi:hypothetical protein